MDGPFGQWLFGQAAVVIVLIGFIWLLVQRRALATAAHLDDLRGSCDDARVSQEKVHIEAIARLERAHADALARLTASERNSDMWREVARTGVITAREAVGVAANHAGAIPPTSSSGSAGHEQPPEHR